MVVGISRMAGSFQRASQVQDLAAGFGRQPVAGANLKVEVLHREYRFASRR